MPLKFHFCAFLFTALLFSLPAFGQEEKEEIRVLKSDASDLPAELEEEKVSITGQKEILLKDAPATVSVINEEDILRSGARDLMDVLRLVPGFEFGTDVQGVACLGVRGNSANEGGLLVLVDGMEMTEILYASNQFGSIYPIDQIRKIEVIRGPGSVLYGGFAVYAVINILTKASEEFNGFRVSNAIGETLKGSPRRNFSASFGGMYEKFNFSISGGTSSANRSDGIYTDTSGRQSNLLDNSGITDRFLIFRLRYGKLHFRALTDFYSLRNQTNLGPISNRTYTLNFSNLNADLRYDFTLSKTMMLRPYLTVRRQSPWHLASEIDSSDKDFIIPFHSHADRISTGTNLDWKPLDNLEITGNAGVWRDNSSDAIDGDSGLTATFTCLSSYVQAGWKTRFFNLSAGTRFDFHSYYSPIFSPRIAINKSIGRQYIKFSFNRSFRTPAIANIVFSINGKILPQLTNYYELEFGGRAGKNLSYALNAYRIEVKDGIIYTVLNNTVDGYSNGGHQGTHGLEAQVSFRNDHGMVLHGSWSAYRNNSGDPGGNYFVPGSRVNLAYPAHKICINAGFPLSSKLRLNGTFLFLSDRYGYDGFDADPVFINYGPAAQWNLFLDYRDVYLKGLNLGFGIFDISNSSYSLIQPYVSHHMPVPALSREFTFRICYGLNPETR